MSERIGSTRLGQALERLWFWWTGDKACAECGKSERPWRKMFVYPLSSTFAYICSDRCSDAFAWRIASQREAEMWEREQEAHRAR